MEWLGDGFEAGDASLHSMVREDLSEVRLLVVSLTVAYIYSTYSGHFLPESVHLAF